MLKLTWYESCHETWSVSMVVLNHTSTFVNCCFCLLSLSCQFQGLFFTLCLESILWKENLQIYSFHIWERHCKSRRKAKLSIVVGRGIAKVFFFLSKLIFVKESFIQRGIFISFPNLLQIRPMSGRDKGDTITYIQEGSTWQCIQPEKWSVFEGFSIMYVAFCEEVINWPHPLGFPSLRLC